MISDDTLYGQIKNRVLTISGNNPSLRVDGGYLVISDGPIPVPADHQGSAQPAGERMVTHRLRRADCPVDRIVVTRPDGFVTFAAIKWLHDVGVSLTQLDWDGTVLVATARRQSDLPAIRRSQAMAYQNELGRSIVRDILREKIKGQAAVAKYMGDETAAATIDDLAKKLEDAREVIDLLSVEAMAASAYWAGWSDLRLRLTKRDRVPDHWKLFGTRRSPISGYPKSAATPGNAILNYLYGVLCSQITISLIGVGLDEGMGLLHTDKPSRASLAYDAMEAARPIIDLWLFDWLKTATFSKRDFYEEGNGTVRVTRPLSSHLAMTAALWRPTAEEIAAWLCKRLSGENPALSVRWFQRLDIERKAKKHALQWQIASALQAPVPKNCLGCGKALSDRRRKFCSESCARGCLEGQPMVAALAALARARGEGKDPSHTEHARRLRVEHYRRHARAVREWRSQPHWSEAYDAKLRQWFTRSLYPSISNCRPLDIIKATGVSTAYAHMIRKGEYNPHPRHYPALAKLAGIAMPALSATVTRARQKPSNDR